MFMAITSVLSVLYLVNGVHALHNDPCILNITKSSVETLTDTFSKNPVIIYVRATFGWFVNGIWKSYDIDPKPYPNWPSSNMSSQFTFRLLFGRMGEALAFIPPDYIPQSLWTLSPGIFHVAIQFNFDPTQPRQGACHNFINRTYSGLHDYGSTWSTFDIISKTILNVTRGLSKPASLKSGLYVCQPVSIVLVNFYEYISHLLPSKYLQFNCITSYFEQMPMNATRLDGIITYKTVRDTVTCVTVFLMIFCPLALLKLLERKNPPTKKDRISKFTDLPIGVQYTLVHWTPSGNAGVALNFARLWFSLLLLAALYVSWNYSTDWYLRSSDFLTSNLIQLSLEIFHPLFCVLLQSVVFLCCTRCKTRLIAETLEAICEEDDSERRRMHPWLFWVELPEHLQIPKHESGLSKLSTLLHYISERSCLMLNYDLWEWLLKKHKNDIKKICCGIPVLWHLVFIFSILIMVIYMFFGILNLIPLTYIASYKCLYKLPQLTNSVITAVVLFIFNFYTVISVSYFLFHCVYTFATVMVFTFIGLLMNASTFNQFFILMISLVRSVVKSFLDIYGTYYKLLEITIDKASEIHNSVAETRQEKKPLTPKQDDHIDNSKMHESVAENEQENKPLMSKLDDDVRIIISEIHESVTETGEEIKPLTSKLDDDDDISVDLKLFWFVVEKCRPLRSEVLKTITKIVVTVCIAYFGTQVIFWTHEIQETKEPSITLATIIIYAFFIWPEKILEIVNSYASKKQGELSFAKQVELAVKDYEKERVLQ